MQKSGQHFSEVCSAKIGALPKEEKQFYVSARPRKLLDHVRDAIRVKHYSIRTEQAYVDWRVKPSATR